MRVFPLIIAVVAEMPLPPTLIIIVLAVDDTVSGTLIVKMMVFVVVGVNGSMITEHRFPILLTE